MILFIDLEVSKKGRINKIGGYIGKNLKNMSDFLFEKKPVDRFNIDILPKIEKEKTVYIFGHNISKFDIEFFPVLAKKIL